MIALDSSALIAIITTELEHEGLMRIVAENDCIIGAPTRFETEMVAHARTSTGHVEHLRRLLGLSNIATVAFTAEHAAISEIAFEQYGKGSGHKAQLNFGDCMAYAVARVAGAPLLFKGNDFVRTDIVPAFVP